MSFRSAASLLLLLAGPIGAAHAGNGAYTSGSGLAALGMGGISVVQVEDTYVLAANPASASWMPDRVDFGLDWEVCDSEVRLRDNALGPNQQYQSRMRNFPIPQVGAAWHVSDRLTLGTSAFFAGFGADYRQSPYERFGSSHRVTLVLAQSGLSGAAAWKLTPTQSVGAALNLSYQVVSLKGGEGFTGLSESPEHVTNQGRDGSAGVGFSLGWRGQLVPGLFGGVSYRSTQWSKKVVDYRGMLPDQGGLDFPQNYRLGLWYEGLPRWALAGEFQRVFYRGERSTGNTANEGGALGADDGPGFGWNDQNVWKLGVQYEWSPRLRVRGGFNYNTKAMPRSQTFFGALAPSVAKVEYTAGASWRFSPKWEVTGYGGFSPYAIRKGDGSIPESAGGGEVDVKSRQYYIGMSFARIY